MILIMVRIKPKRITKSGFTPELIKIGIGPIIITAPPTSAAPLNIRLSITRNIPTVIIVKLMKKRNIGSLMNVKVFDSVGDRLLNPYRSKHPSHSNVPGVMHNSHTNFPQP